MLWFILTNIIVVFTENPTRQMTRHYYLWNYDRIEVLVWKIFFKNTLCSSDARSSWLKKNKSSISPPPLDHRGHSLSAKLTSCNKVQWIKDCINSIPSYTFFANKCKIRDYTNFIIIVLFVSSFSHFPTLILMLKDIKT